MTYNPLTGTDYTQAEAQAAWTAGMSRANRDGPKWSLHGVRPAEFWWSFFGFRNWAGQVRVEADGFHWSTHDYGTGELIVSGVTTSVYEVYQSVTRNEIVRRG